MSVDAGTSAAELSRARTLCALRRWDEARALLHELLARDPDNGTAWCLLAQALHGLDDDEGALEAAGHAAALEPDNEWPHRLRSLVLQRLGDPEGAVAAAREAVAAGPHVWQTHARLAVALSQTKRRPKEAIAAGERAVELAPHQADSHYALGVAADAAKHREQAAASFEQALALDPQHSPSHNALARQRLRASRFGRAGNLADAAAGFRTSVQTDPTARYAVHNLELALRVFLARVSYLILLTAYVGIHATRDTLADRVGPLVLLAIPVTYAVRFDRRLAPDLRRHVRYIAVHGKLALPSTAQACAVTALFAAAVVRGGARTDLLGAAFVLALAARIVLALDVRRHQRRRRR